MRMNLVLRLASLAIISLSICLSCTSAPSLAPSADVAVLVEPAPIAIVETKPLEQTKPAPFDPAAVSVELKQATFFNVKALIQSLNSTIQAKDYAAWSAVLTKEYADYYSSSDTLTRISDAPVIKRQGIVLNSLQDYFIYVVYPSRQNDRVDDIEFIETNRIRAITINLKGERLVLYNLEKIGDTWKIAIWR